LVSLADQKERMLSCGGDQGCNLTIWFREELRVID
jgi:hypothetical protein